MTTPRCAALQSAVERAEESLRHVEERSRQAVEALSANCTPSKPNLLANLNAIRAHRRRLAERGAGTAEIGTAQLLAAAIWRLADTVLTQNAKRKGAKAAPLNLRGNSSGYWWSRPGSNR